MTALRLKCGLVILATFGTILQQNLPGTRPRNSSSALGTSRLSSIHLSVLRLETQNIIIPAPCLLSFLPSSYIFSTRFWVPSSTFTALRSWTRVCSIFQVRSGRNARKATGWNARSNTGTGRIRKQMCLNASLVLGQICSNWPVVMVHKCPRYLGPLLLRLLNSQSARRLNTEAVRICSNCGPQKLPQNAAVCLWKVMCFSSASWICLYNY